MGLVLVNFNILDNSLKISLIDEEFAISLP